MYGITTQPKSWNPLWVNFEYWIDLFKDMTKVHKAADAFRMLVLAPGWKPADMGGMLAYKEVTADTFQKYDTSVSPRLNNYIFFQFVVLLLGTSAFLFGQKNLDMTMTGVVSILIIYTVVTIGGLFERKTWVVPAELIRIIVLAGHKSDQPGAFRRIVDVNDALEVAHVVERLEGIDHLFHPCIEGGDDRDFQQCPLAPVQDAFSKDVGRHETEADQNGEADEERHQRPAHHAPTQIQQNAEIFQSTRADAGNRVIGDLRQPNGGNERDGNDDARESLVAHHSHQVRAKPSPGHDCSRQGGRYRSDLLKGLGNAHGTHENVAYRARFAKGVLSS